jgi:ADP-ribosylglycohydrolase
MRLAPIPLFFKDSKQRANWMDMAVMSSILTHGSYNCMGSCVYLSALIMGALNELPKEDILNPDYFFSDEFVKKALKDFTPEVLDIVGGV